MSSKRIFYIIVFSSVSLVGLVVSQLIWVNNALDLAEKHHAHRVDLALEDVLEELVDLVDSVKVQEEFTDGEPKDLFDILDTLALQF